MRLRRFFRRWLAIGLTLAVLFVLLCNRWVINSTDSRVVANLALLPENEYGLVLGTSAYTRGGESNPHFYGRIEAAVELYRAGKVRRLIVSGANPDASYNEPRRMQQELVKAGIPSSEIVMDFAGDRTFDSIARAQAVYGLYRATVITQGYHGYRAVFIGRKLGMQVVAYAAPGRDGPAPLPYLREVFARVRAVMDIFLFNRAAQIGSPARQPTIGEEVG